MKIALVGYYGAGNFGDELMLEGILQVLPRDIEISILSFGGSSIECAVPSWMHIEKRTIKSGATLKSKINALKGLVRVIGKADVVLFGGGTIFFDKVDRGYRNLFGPLKVAFFAQLLRKRLVIYGCGIEELSSTLSRIIVKYIFNTCDSIYLRDKKSIELVDQIGVRLRQGKLAKVFDPAWLVRYSPDGKLPQAKSSKPTVVFCLMETSFRKTGFFLESIFLDILSEGVTHFINAGYTSLLLPMQKAKFRNDNRIHQLLYDRLTREQKRNVLLVEVVDYEQKKEILWLSSKIISMRYHPLVVGHLAGKDCLALSVSGKSKQFAMHTFGEGSLVDLTCEGWEHDLKRKILLPATTSSSTLCPAGEREYLLAQEQFVDMLKRLQK